MNLDTEVSEGLRIAVILHGLVHRSLMHVVEILRDKVIFPLTQAGKVDVFYHSWDVMEIHNPRSRERGISVDTTEVAKLLPEARGIFESQEEFDRTVEWERWFERNPMRHCTENEDAARATLMNFRRALESQERAWQFFQKTKTRRYDVVVATRADLRFLDVLEVPAMLAPLHEHRSNEERSNEHFIGIDAHRAPLHASLWLPGFHSWGGVNDRFVMGNEEGVGIWSNRVAFAEEWLEKANGESAEWLLMKWLEKNRVRVGFLDFTFQRVRANGEVAERDRELRACEWNGKKGGGQDARAKERFLILTREAGTAAESLRRVLQPLGQVEVIADRPAEAGYEGRCDREAHDQKSGDGCNSLASTVTDRRYIHVSDEESDGYGGLMSTSGPFPKITAWSRAFVHLARTLEDDEAVWFVEDDVAGNFEAFAELVSKTAFQNPDLAALELKTKQEDKHWPWWSYAKEHFEDPCRGFQPLCRLSGRLVRKILDFRESHGCFTFHEVLFPSLSHAAGMRWLDWKSNAAFKHLFVTFRYRPNVTAVCIGISHPVKDAAVHEATCSAPPAELPRMRLAKCEGYSILAEDYAFLSRHCRINGIKKVVEFGPGDSTLAFLDAGCRVLSFEHDIGWLEKATRRFQGEDAVSLMHCPEGTVPETSKLPFMPEMVFVDGPPLRQGQEMSRLLPCEWALELCGYFLLHDTKRDAELATLAEMERRGMHVKHICTRKGLAIVVDPQRRPEMIPDKATGFWERYRDTSRSGWFNEDFYTWSLLFRETSQPVRVLETGAGNGLSLNLMLDALFPHPASEGHAVDLYDDETGIRQRESFKANAERGGHVGQLHLYEGTTCEVLAWMISGEGFWESFDFIHLNGGADTAEMLADACQAWSLLKAGGILIFGDGDRNGAGFASFTSVFGTKIQQLIDGRRKVVRKRA